LTIRQEAQVLLATGKIYVAHALLEEIRYLLWGMHVQAVINSVADKANDFHEAMEIILDHAAAAKNAVELSAVEARYGAWVASSRKSMPSLLISFRSAKCSMLH